MNEAEVQKSLLCAVTLGWDYSIESDAWNSMKVSTIVLIGIAAQQSASAVLENLGLISLTPCVHKSSRNNMGNDCSGRILGPSLPTDLSWGCQIMVMLTGHDLNTLDFCGHCL